MKENIGHTKIESVGLIQRMIQQKHITLRLVLCQVLGWVDFFNPLFICGLSVNLKFWRQFKWMIKLKSFEEFFYRPRLKDGLNMKSTVKSILEMLSVNIRGG